MSPDTRQMVDDIRAEQERLNPIRYQTFTVHVDRNMPYESVMTELQAAYFSRMRVRIKESMDKMDKGNLNRIYGKLL